MTILREWIILKRTTIPSVGKNVKQPELICTILENSLPSPIKIDKYRNLCLNSPSYIPNRHTCSGTLQNMYMNIHSKQPKGLSTAEWINTLAWSQNGTVYSKENE